MVFWWVRNPYLNNKQIQTRYAVLMNDTYGSSVSFGSSVRSKYIIHNTYTGRRCYLCPKTTPINGTIHKSDFIFHTQDVT